MILSHHGHSIYCITTIYNLQYAVSEYSITAVPAQRLAHRENGTSEGIRFLAAEGHPSLDHTLPGTGCTGGGKGEQSVRRERGRAGEERRE